MLPYNRMGPEPALVVFDDSLDLEVGDHAVGAGDVDLVALSHIAEFVELAGCVPVHGPHVPRLADHRYDVPGRLDGRTTY